ncbi:protein of unknown function [Halolactibacillus halophilus]|uniref:Uncharacterized protein n=1 Tax=Halolactibacillus halophilus TaxID=306540 RepID=A0A1I5Q0U4_9BACI|nr:Kiwa anti-phage protein KwaB-like domain-containing protein [Halolactibacillus halophilus]GEM01925.1 hypothetical protein HHA03_14570 [Halolactibacillus halophilus]SFP39660.1 protein of unknown function [Halolactibacillus halophilus]
MDINSEKSIINQICDLENLEELDIDIYLISKAKTLDKKFISQPTSLDRKLRDWIKQNIQLELKKLKKEDEDGQKKFHVESYSHEIIKRDYIAKLDCKTDKQLLDKKTKLISSLNSKSPGIDNNANKVKFQVIKANIKNNSVYLIYYRGIKEHSLRKKHSGRIPSLRNGDQLVIHDKDILEFGGKIELIIINDELLVVSPRTLEYTFDYTDHISEKRDENLNRITQMGFFDECSNVGKFTEKSSQYILSRSLASIKKDTLEVLEEKFEERCEDLKEIKKHVPKDKNSKSEYLDKYKAIWPLYDYLDLDNYKVRFNEEQSVTPLLHFFSDKIVESFLTKKFRSN